MVTILYTQSELIELSQESNWVAESGAKILCLDLREAGFSDDDAERVNAWLSNLSVPVVGLVDGECQLLQGLDLLVVDLDELSVIESCISENPVASAVLVQTTRMTAQLPVPYALIAESLAYATLQGGSEFAGWLSSRGDRPPNVSARTSAEPVKLDRRGNLLTITLASPDNRNALSAIMRDALTDAFSLVAMDKSIRHVTVSGEGPCFSAGGDLTEFGSCTDLSEAHRIRQLRMPGGFLADHADRYTFELHGACIGAGVEIPAFASRVLAAPDTFFRLPEISMGLIPGAGGCVSLPRRIGRHRTNYIAVTGQDFTAEEALAWGLIDEIVKSA